MKYIYIANLNLHDKREARSLRSLANYISARSTFAHHASRQILEKEHVKGVDVAVIKLI